jgi:hypothetical protein
MAIREQGALACNENKEAVKGFRAFYFYPNMICTLLTLCAKPLPGKICLRYARTPDKVIGQLVDDISDIPRTYIYLDTNCSNLCEAPFGVALRQSFK